MNMNDEVLPVLPLLDQYPEGASAEEQERINVEGTTEFDAKYAHLRINPRQARHLIDQCRMRSVPTSLYNLEVFLARYELDETPEQGTWDDPITRDVPLTPEEKGIQKVGSMGTVKINYPVGSAPERQLVGERPERFEELLGDSAREQQEHLKNIRALSDIGKPVSAELREVARISRETVRAARRPSPSEVAEARAQVGLEHPELPIGSTEFGALVSEKLGGSQAIRPETRWTKAESR